VNFSPAIDLAALLLLIPLFAGGLFSDRLATLTAPLPRALRFAAPGLLCVPYLLVVLPSHYFQWTWFGLYLLVPVAVAGLLWISGRMDPTKTGTWIDFAVLGGLGLAIDLQWFEQAWPPGLTVFGKMILLDAAIYGFMLVRRLEGVGFDLRLRWSDFATGAREFLLYAPIGLVMGFALGFFHPHADYPTALEVLGGVLFTFLFIAIPEELFFRGWMQSLLERRLGRWPALGLTSVLFGLSHFNKQISKQTLTFNWRYVLLATAAGVFYGLAWRRNRRVAASSITHTLVDTFWSIFLR
jgi:membrane protease YdiL (CAAX protease family)